MEQFATLVPSVTFETTHGKSPARVEFRGFTELDVLTGEHAVCMKDALNSELYVMLTVETSLNAADCFSEQNT